MEVRIVGQSSRIALDFDRPIFEVDSGVILRMILLLDFIKK